LEQLLAALWQHVLVVTRHIYLSGVVLQRSNYNILLGFSVGHGRHKTVNFQHSKIQTGME
jgi:hypothetical protein